MHETLGPPGTITPTELHRRREADEALQLVDIREPWEAAIVSIAGSELIPLSRLLHSLDQLSTEHPVVLYCHHGARSEQALSYLRANGHDNIEHLHGGIAAWADHIDDSLPRY